MSSFSRGGGGGDEPTPTSEAIDVSNEISGIPNGVPTTILSYAVPVGKTLMVNYVGVSGNNRATFTVEIGSAEIAKRRTYYTHFNESFFAGSEGLEVLESKTVYVKVVNNSLSLGTFNANLLGVLL